MRGVAFSNDPARVGAPSGTRRPYLRPPVVDQLYQFYDPARGVTLVSGKVSSWADASGNGHDVTQGTAANRPTRTASSIGGRPAITFAPQSWLDSGTIALALPHSIAFVARVDNFHASYVMFCTHDGAGPMVFATSTTISARPDGSNLISGSADLSQASLVIVTASGGTGKIYVNGTQVATGAILSSGTATLTKIGVESDFVKGLDGPLAFYASWSKLLSAGEIASLTTWSQATWGTP